MHLKNSKIIVIKIGSSLIVDKNRKIRNKWLSSFAKDIKKLRSNNKKVVIVSSGAIALGSKKTKSMTWDARCLRHHECPFFNYDGEYGGECDNGYCKFPPGLKQISYKKYKISDNICEQQIK